MHYKAWEHIVNGFRYVTTCSCVWLLLLTSSTVSENIIAMYGSSSFSKIVGMGSQNHWLQSMLWLYDSGTWQHPHTETHRSTTLLDFSSAMCFVTSQWMYGWNLNLSSLIREYIAVKVLKSAVIHIKKQVHHLCSHPLQCILNYVTPAVSQEEHFVVSLGLTQSRQEENG